MVGSAIRAAAPPLALPIENTMLPLTEWPSCEITRQLTRWEPCARPAGSASSTRACSPV